MEKYSKLNKVDIQTLDLVTPTLCSMLMLVRTSGTSKYISSSTDMLTYEALRFADVRVSAF